MGIIASILTGVEWIGTAVLLVLMYRIAYFYQVTSKQPTHYLWFFVPMGLLLAGGLRYAMLMGTTTDLWADLLMLAGGLLLIALGMNLLREMTGGPR
jgi:hypothetical protein